MRSSTPQVAQSVRYRDEFGGKRGQPWDGDPQARAKKEQVRMSRAVDELVLLMSETCEGNVAQLRLAAGGRRASTLKKRANVWKRFRAWLLGSKGRLAFRASRTG